MLGPDNSSTLFLNGEDECCSHAPQVKFSIFSYNMPTSNHAIWAPQKMSQCRCVNISLEISPFSLHFITLYNGIRCLGKVPANCSQMCLSFDVYAFPVLVNVLYSVIQPCAPPPVRPCPHHQPTPSLSSSCHSSHSTGCPPPRLPGYRPPSASSSTHSHPLQRLVHSSLDSARLSVSSEPTVVLHKKPPSYDQVWTKPFVYYKPTR